MFSIPIVNRYYSSSVIFQVITLPVEFNASRRAIKQLDSSLIGTGEIHGVKQVLGAAALTYIAATLVALVQLIHLISETKKIFN